MTNRNEDIEEEDTTMATNKNDDSIEYESSTEKHVIHSKLNVLPFEILVAVIVLVNDEKLIMKISNSTFPHLNYYPRLPVV